MRKPHISRRRFVTAAGAAGITGLAGCTGGDDDDGGAQETTTDSGGSDDTTTDGATTTTQAQKGGTVHFLNDRAARETWEAAAKEFSSQSDYDVDITWLPKGTSTNEQVAKMKAAGNLPALIFETSTDCYRETKEGITEPLTDVVADLGVKDTVPVDGESYMVPGVAIPLIGMYRTDIFDSAPTTRDEWTAEAERVQNEEGMSGYVVPSGRTNPATTHANQTLWNGGVDPYSGAEGDIEVVIDQGDNRSLAVDTFDWLAEVNEFGPNASGWGWGDLIGGLIQEQLAAWAGLGGLGMLELKANRPDLADSFAPCPYPVASGQEPTQWWSYFEGMYSYADAENTEGAKEFLRFFMGSDYYFEFLRETALFNFPTSLEGLEDERYASSELIKAHPEFLQIVRDNWDEMAPVLQTGDDGAPNIIAANAYGQQLYGQAIDQLLYGGKSSEETVDWLAAELRKLA